MSSEVETIIFTPQIMLKFKINAYLCLTTQTTNMDVLSVR